MQTVSVTQGPAALKHVRTPAVISLAHDLKNLVRWLIHFVKKPNQPLSGPQVPSVAQISARENDRAA